VANNTGSETASSTNESENSGGGASGGVSKVWTDPADADDNISPDGQYAYDAEVAMDDNGNAMIVWYQSDATNDRVFRSEYRSGSWTHPTDLTDNISPSAGDAEYPQVAMDNNGNAVIAWRQRDGSLDCGGGPCFQTFKSEYRSGTWTDPTSLSDNISPNGQLVDAVQVAMDNNGNVIIVWEQLDGTVSCGGGPCKQIFKSEYRSGSWTDPTDLTDSISPNGQGASDPQVAMYNNGNAIIVWHQSDGARQQTFKSEYRGGSWTDPSDVTDNISPDGEHAKLPQVAMDDNGNALIVWEQDDGTIDCGGFDCHQTFKSEYRSASWTHPSGLTDNITINASADDPLPKVAMDNNGNAIIVFENFDSTASFEQIFMSNYR